MKIANGCNEVKEVKSVNEELRKFIDNEEGMGTVEVILIIVVLVGLVIIFKKQITEIVNSLFDGITEKTDEITG